jgi:propanol-preferring alcohol dehydrogenase
LHHNSSVRAQQLRTPAPADERPLRAVALDDPVPGRGEVLVDVAACAVCRTDLQLCEGELEARRLPIVPGHQIVGRIAATGEGVDAGRVGQRVGIAWLASTCGRCRFCLTDRENLCVRARFTGWDRDGGYAERTVARADFVYELPDGFDDLAAAPLLCGGVIGYRSLKVAGVRPGMRLGLYGFGASASIVIQVAVHLGCSVYVVTRSSAEQDRARDLGATWVGGTDDSPPEPLDAAVTFAPVGDVVVRALSDLDRGGVVAVNAIHLDRIPEFDYDRLWWERQIRSVANVTRTDVRELLDLAARIPIRTEYETAGLDRANDALVRLARGEVRSTSVLRVG